MKYAEFTQYDRDALAIQQKYFNDIVCEKCGNNQIISHKKRFNWVDGSEQYFVSCYRCKYQFSTLDFILMAVRQLPSIRIVFPEMKIPTVAQISGDTCEMQVTPTQPVATTIAATGTSGFASRPDRAFTVLGKRATTDLAIKPIAFVRARGNDDEDQVALLKETVKSLTDTVKTLQDTIAEMAAQITLLKTQAATKIVSEPVVLTPGPLPDVGGEMAQTGTQSKTAKVPKKSASSSYAQVLAGKPGTKLSFDQIADSQLEHRRAATKAFLIANQKARTTTVKAKPATYEAETQTKSRMHHVYGFGFMRISELRKHLKAMQFDVSKILNIRHCGRSVVEFLVRDDYSTAFETRVKYLPILSLAQNFDPRAYRGANATLETQTNASKRFAAGAAKAIVNAPRAEAKAFFRLLLDESDESIKRLAEAEIRRLEAKAPSESKTGEQAAPKLDALVTHEDTPAQDIPSDSNVDIDMAEVHV
jgi:hypothetical protein